MTVSSFYTSGDIFTRNLACREEATPSRTNTPTATQIGTFIDTGIDIDKLADT